MIYKIAGLTAHISGDSRLDKSEVVFEKPEDALVYTRRACNNPFDLNKNTLPSEEESSSDGMLPLKDDETEKLNIKKFKTINAVISGCDADENGNSLYVLRRLEGYMTTGAAHSVLVPDFTIKYRILPEIGKPVGEYLGEMRGFKFYKDDRFYYLTKSICEIDEILTKIIFDDQFKTAEIELFDVEGLGGLPLEQRIHSYLCEAFSYLALTKGRVVFHSSAISYKDMGICFSAPSGTGKSTHTGLWKKYYKDKTEIINDDTPVLYVNSENAVLCGTPWSGKTELNINKEVDLKGIVFLTQSKDNHIKKLSNLEAIKYFFNEAKIPQIPALFDKGIEIIGDVLKCTPTFLLGCNISKDAVELVKDTLCM